MSESSTTSISLSKSTKFLVPLFTLTLGLSAFLLFWIQPLIAKVLLPHFGGSPAVWTTSMVFFQAVLLAGYSYAHLLARMKWLHQVAIHASLLVFAVFFLPFGVSDSLLEMTGGWEPSFQLLAVLGLSVGVPFLVVSATAPLLQVWFSYTTHKDAEDPYFLYGASNFGSLLALLAFPIVLETTLGLGNQSVLWATGFAMLAVLILTAYGAGQSNRSSVADGEISVDEATTVAWQERLKWLVYALVPSAFLNSFTLKISTDIAAAPLLWVIPLSLYLVTFIFVFARKPIVDHGWVVRYTPMAALMLLILPWVSHTFVGLLLHFPAFFLITLMCHGELAARRPDKSHLTEFYLWMSLGGVVGGGLTAVLAPLVFNSLVEYPIALAGALLLLPGASKFKTWKLDAGLAVGALIVALAIGAYAVRLIAPTSEWAPFADNGVIVFLAVVGLCAYAMRDLPVRYGLIIGACLLADTYTVKEGEILHRERSFFGIYKILNIDDQYTMFLNGTTAHGAQARGEADQTSSILYYHQDGAFADVFNAVHQVKPKTEVGVIGLGCGGMACYRRPGDNWTFYEIDPVVADLAKNPKYFTYLDKCASGESVRIDDGRKAIEKLADGSMDVLVVDAFTSDAIPIHLITKEAIALYMSKLKDDGVLAMHVSNRYLELRPIIHRIAGELGLNGILSYHDIEAELARIESNEGLLFSPARIVVLAKKDFDLETLPFEHKWTSFKDFQTDGLAWTDDRSNIVEAINWF